MRTESQGTNYYSFGMQMPGRSFTSSAYRYGFNGKEKDDEVKGSGNSYDYGARIYDSRIGRWLSLDPLQKKYPQLTPFSFVADNPILFIDKNGTEIWIAYTAFIGGKPFVQKLQYKNGELYNANGTKSTSTNAYLIAVKKELNELKTDTKESKAIVQELESNSSIHTISNTNKDVMADTPVLNESNPDYKDEKGKDLPDGSSFISSANPWTANEGEKDNEKTLPKIVLIHELKHSQDIANGDKNAGQTTENGILLEEVNAVKTENFVRAKENIPLRTSYSGVPIAKKYLDKKGDVTPADVKKK